MLASLGPFRRVRMIRMSSGVPWSVKGIDPKARETAKDLARRSGLTLGEWLTQMIEDGMEVVFQA